MPKYKVFLHQYSEEIAEVEVEADSVAEAADLGVEESSDADWSDGDQTIGLSAYEVLDENGKVVWKDGKVEVTFVEPLVIDPKDYEEEEEVD